MKILEFVKDMKKKAITELLTIAETGKCVENTYKFQSGHADIVTIRGGALEKAAIMEMVVRDIPTPGQNGKNDAMVYQMEIFPENPYCPMGHFNTEWSMKEQGFYYMNIDLFPAIKIQQDIDTVKSLMDKVAEEFNKDKHSLREGLDAHYNMEHWGEPLAVKAGFKLMELKEDELDLFIKAYHSFFEGYLALLKKRKEMPFGTEETRRKMERNGRWLEYLALKDRAIKLAESKGVPPEVIVAFGWPPSAVF